MTARLATRARPPGFREEPDCTGVVRQATFGDDLSTARDVAFAKICARVEGATSLNRCWRLRADAPYVADNPAVSHWRSQCVGG